MIQEALNIVYSYICGHYESEMTEILKKELLVIARLKKFLFEVNDKYTISTYEEVQEILSKLNEKESIRKSKGVYYTPTDVVNFILCNSIKARFGKLKENNIANLELDSIPYKAFSTKTTVFDPTCGAGEYLLNALEIKMDLLKKHNVKFSKEMLKKMAATICGNDINIESVIIAELRLFLCFVERTNSKNCADIGKILNASFSTIDFVSHTPDNVVKYDIIVGNPPYVEDSKSGLQLDTRYGNIYANVLKHSALLLQPNGVIGFIIPLSYVSTPRMKKIRDELLGLLPEQIILNYADRPDCLFDSVHQKLSILFGKNNKVTKRVYTGNYQYWYKDERDALFSKTEIVKNKFILDDFVPKLGTDIDLRVFEKIFYGNTESVYAHSRLGTEKVYLNRREAFWMKAYRTQVDDPEYKVFSYNTAAEADYCYCLIHSSLFWWYWICTSDCWHVSKELNGFRAPLYDDYHLSSVLADNLARKLEETKVYVGTRQTEYEYKHRECITEIRAIDDYINDLFGLTDEESEYIKNFAFRYRISGGAVENGNS